MKMKILLLVAALGLTSSACDQVARLTRLHSAAPLVASTGELGTVGWQPLVDGQMYAVWRHDYTLGAPCNEFDSEPLAETNNEGTPCPSFVP